MTRTILIILAAGACLTGCNSNSANAPRETLRHVVESVQKGDRGQFLASVFYGPLDEDFAMGTFDMMEAMYEFNADTQRIYGKDASDLISPSIPLFDADRIQYMEVHLMGDRATIQMPGADPQTSPPIFMVRVQDKWLLDLAKDVPAGEMRERTILTCRAMAKVLQDFRRCIGRPDYTYIRLHSELATALAHMAAELSSPTTRPAP